MFILHVCNMKLLIVNLCFVKHHNRTPTKQTRTSQGLTVSVTFDPEMVHHGPLGPHQLTETDPDTPTHQLHRRPPGSDSPTPIFSSSVGVHMLVPLLGGWPPLPPRTVFSRRTASWRSSPPSLHPPWAGRTELLTGSSVSNAAVAPLGCPCPGEAACWRGWRTTGAHTSTSGVGPLVKVGWSGSATRVPSRQLLVPVLCWFP